MKIAGCLLGTASVLVSRVGVTSPGIGSSVMSLLTFDVIAVLKDVLLDESCEVGTSILVGKS